MKPGAYVQNYCQSSCAKIIKRTQDKHGVDLQLQLRVYGQLDPWSIRPMSTRTF